MTATYANEQIILGILRENLGDWKDIDSLRNDPRVYQRMGAQRGVLGQYLARLERRGQIERDIRGGKRIARAIMTPDSERTGRTDLFTAGVIPNGSQVQYRKVGQGTVRFHECKFSGRDCDGTASQHLYLVHFTTGPYRGESKQVWVRNSEVIKLRERAAVPALPERPLRWSDLTARHRAEREQLAARHRAEIEAFEAEYPAAPVPPLRLRLARQLEATDLGSLTLAEILPGSGASRADVIAELASMRDDGQVEFWGPRYRILPAGRLLAEIESN